MSRDKKSNYYDAGGIETLDIIKAKLTPRQYQGYLLGNAIKYACRLNFKGHTTRDAEKLKNYSAWLKDQLNSHELPENMDDVEVITCDSCSCSECDRDYIADIRKSAVHG